MVGSEVKHVRCEAAGKPSLKRANELSAVDLKPSDLPMARVKLR